MHNARASYETRKGTGCNGTRTKCRVNSLCSVCSRSDVQCGGVAVGVGVCVVGDKVGWGANAQHQLQLACLTFLRQAAAQLHAAVPPQQARSSFPPSLPAAVVPARAPATAPPHRRLWAPRCRPANPAKAGSRTRTQALEHFQSIPDLKLGAVANIARRHTRKHRRSCTAGRPPAQPARARLLMPRCFAAAAGPLAAPSCQLPPQRPPPLEAAAWPAW